MMDYLPLFRATTGFFMEPPVGFEPTTCSLREGLSPFSLTTNTFLKVHEVTSGAATPPVTQPDPSSFTHLLVFVDQNMIKLIYFAWFQNRSTKRISET